ncbi:hypothetical protein [Synechococcus sp. BIOS-U3-1]|uniref:hypothetical protein n=1 Tax=Synechococcus sp. BIOS-U3-1 TaxID=1400865 RepID=UPI002106727C|nr:hypothetical protein [Synechococcus sp. BIOS-U3-1]
MLRPVTHFQALQSALRRHPARWIAAAVLGVSCGIAQRAEAGFPLEQLEAFEVTEMKATVTTSLPAEKVIEVIDPHGHKEILTVGIDLEPLGLKQGDEVSLSILDGLVVELEASTNKELSFNREDIILPADMGKLKKGMRLALASGTAQVISIDRQDNSIDLLGPLGGINNLDVVISDGASPFDRIKVGDTVDFRLIQPLAVNVRKLPRSSTGNALKSYRGSGEPLLISPLADQEVNLKSELLEAFELVQLNATIERLVPGQKLLNVKGARGHSMLITSAIDPTAAGLKVGDQVNIEMLQGLVVDLRSSQQTQLSLLREDRRLGRDFGPVPAGARVAMASGTAEVVRLSRTDHMVTLRGPLGKIHKLDIRPELEDEVFAGLSVGDMVDFRLIKPIAIRIQPVAQR